VAIYVAARANCIQALSQTFRQDSICEAAASLICAFGTWFFPDGTSVPLNASLISVGDKKTNEEGEVQSGTSGKTAAKDVGVGAGIGTVAGLILGGPFKGLAMGAIAGGGYVLAAKGKDVEIPADSAMRLRLDQSLYLPPYAGGR